MRRPRLHPEDKPWLEMIARQLGVLPRSARVMLEKCGFAVCDECERFHKKTEACIEGLASEKVH